MGLRRVVLLGCAAALVLAASVSATPLGSSGRHAVRRRHRRVPGRRRALQRSQSADLTTRPGANWITNGGDVSNARYSSLNQINTTNVSQLKEAWHVHLDGSGKAAKYSAEGTPVVYNGVMYLPTG